MAKTKPRQMSRPLALPPGKLLRSTSQAGCDLTIRNDGKTLVYVSSDDRGTLTIRQGEAPVAPVAVSP